MAIWVIAVVAVAPCQCFWPGGPDHVAGADLLDRFGLIVRPAAAGDNDQGLPQRMGMPRSARAGLEGHGGSADPCSSPWNRESILTAPVKYSLAPLVDGCEPLRIIFMASFRFEGEG